MKAQHRTRLLLFVHQLGLGEQFVLSSLQARSPSAACASLASQAALPRFMIPSVRRTGPATVTLRPSGHLNVPSAPRNTAAQAREFEPSPRAVQASAQQSKAEAQPSAGRDREVSDSQTPKRSERAAFPDSAYPTKDSTSGGWAGGEVGLRNFLQSATTQEQDTEDASAAGHGATQKSAAKKTAGRQAAASKPTDPQMYPSKTSLSGGFAGGERGLQQFVEEGKISFADQGSSQYSPLIVALVVSVGITAAALLLNAEVEQGEQALGPITLPRIKSLNIDAATVPLVQAAAIGLAVLGLVTGSGILARKIGEGTNRAAVTVLNGARIVVFWLGLFLAVKVVLDSS